MIKSSRSEFIAIRGLQYHVRHWGDESAPKIFMLHGWMDVSASFQFVVDCLKQDWHVIAPDWRGFGLTDTPNADCYWFPDYMGDLDAILQHYSPDEAVNLIGHSMGANVAGIFAGVRPERIKKFVNLEGFGMPVTTPGQAPGRYLKWLDELRQTPVLRTYASQAEVAGRLQKTNPRLSDERANFLSQHWAKQNAEGQWEILGDPAHKLTSPLLYHVEEVMACWEKITAPVLWFEADDTNVWHWMGPKSEARTEIDRRLAHIPKLQKEMIKNAGHMLHHDQPEILAELIEQFLLA
ncbi:alpha/beta hydrolase [Undibacterium sp. RTI2.1]|uniref:alpha/beta fold hydrolase n=1 Tax=unclassified Undibacterium TaxID=2630295 RepID=UPI002AB4AE33|nr:MULTISPECIES: alpha/beta hydrolase [unclassified Undibacterium]MDY7537088.1 alpha/beta hydrolase [Undibacterium sp. 5I1]MEB0029873.1 alpha/beta hydrolase [Undibacterium sp. RTI2.1]MEB0115158.1 alpha/beta hydrolase [Undibacterium sp. RTI2.2]MEB0229266.1 alpha/beta hydrolase [Undibacterium sp. 10I3]MEB0256186.1 alpha/beta hydrolase [Undibacterium sp. 5I1]